MSINVTAIIKSKPEFLEEIKTALQDLVMHTRKENACIAYDLYEDLNDENTFLFQEIWEDATGLEAHEKQPHFTSFFGDFSAKRLDGEPIIFKTKKFI